VRVLTDEDVRTAPAASVAAAAREAPLQAALENGLDHLRQEPALTGQLPPFSPCVFYSNTCKY